MRYTSRAKEYMHSILDTPEQARLTYNFIRAALEPTGAYRWIDTATRLGATHKASNTKLQGHKRATLKSSFGLVNTFLLWWLMNLGRWRSSGARCWRTPYSRRRARLEAGSS